MAALPIRKGQKRVVLGSRSHSINDNANNEFREAESSFNKPFDLDEPVEPTANETSNEPITKTTEQDKINQLLRKETCCFGCLDLQLALTILFVAVILLTVPPSNYIGYLIVTMKFITCIFGIYAIWYGKRGYLKAAKIMCICMIIIHFIEMFAIAIGVFIPSITKILVHVGMAFDIIKVILYAEIAVAIDRALEIMDFVKRTTITTNVDLTTVETTQVVVV